MSVITSCTGKLNELINQSISRANFNDCIEFYRFILHNPLFYKHLHKKHHELKATIAISTLYCHPIENAVNLGTVAIVSWLKIKQDFVRRNLNYVFQIRVHWYVKCILPHFCAGSGSLRHCQFTIIWATKCPTCSSSFHLHRNTISITNFQSMKCMAKIQFPITCWELTNVGGRVWPRN